MNPSRITLSLDEQFLSGDPTALRPRLAPYAEREIPICVETADLGRSCYESLILLRPQRILLDPQLSTGIAANRARRLGLQRFVSACDSLGVSVVGTGVVLDSDRDALRAAGVRYAAGPS